MLSSDLEIRMLSYNCPATKRPVETSIDTSSSMLKRLGQFKLSLWCPHCQTGHQIVACDAFVTDRMAGFSNSITHQRPAGDASKLR